MKIPFRDIPAPVRDELLAALRGTHAKRWYVRIYEDLVWHKGVSAIGLGCLLIIGVFVVAGVERELYAGWAAVMVAASMLGSWLILTGRYLLHLHRERLVPRSVVATPYIIAYMKSEDDLVELYPVADIRKATVTIYEHRNKKTGQKWHEHRLSFRAGAEFVCWSAIEGHLVFDYLQHAAGLERDSEEAPRGPANLAKEDPSAGWPPLLAEAATRPASPLPRRWPLAVQLGMLVGMLAWLVQLVLTEGDLWHNVNAYQTTHQCSRYAFRAPFGWHKDEAFDELWVKRLVTEAVTAQERDAAGKASEMSLWKAKYAIEEYLRLMPRGKYRADIASLHDDIFWAWAESNGLQPRDIRFYLDDFPNGLHASEARRLLHPAEESR
ncbi:MAG TPA: hypothetical protein PLP29_19535 [Candidatus Ozemobacteraceae bacterium]|nr:hypothetical protein [Candidatus Ozemobacteraceae bacterium]